MYWIRKEADEKGNYGQPSTKGDIILPDEFLAQYLDAMGFVKIEVEAGEVVSLSRNEEAYSEYIASVPEDEPQPDTVEDIMLDLLADHEYRLCMLELGMEV